MVNMQVTKYYCDWCTREVNPDRLISNDVGESLAEITIDVKGGIPRHFALCYICHGELLNTIDELVRLKGWKKQ